VFRDKVFVQFWMTVQRQNKFTALERLVTIHVQIRKEPAQLILCRQFVVAHLRRRIFRLARRCARGRAAVWRFKLLCASGPERPLGPQSALRTPSSGLEPIADWDHSVLVDLRERNGIQLQSSDRGDYDTT